MSFVCQLEIHLPTLSRQKSMICWGGTWKPSGAPRYLRMVPGIWIWHPVSWSHTRMVPTTREITKKNYKLSLALEAYSYKRMVCSSSLNVGSIVGIRTPRSFANRCSHMWMEFDNLTPISHPYKRSTCINASSGWVLRAKSIGSNGYPWKTPYSRGIGFENWPLTWILTKLSMINPFIRQRNFPPSPIASRVTQM